MNTTSLLNKLKNEKLTLKEERYLKKHLTKSLDSLASLAVRTRDDFTCKRCGKKDKYVHNSHIFSRSNFSTRFDPENGITLCYYCHIKWAHHEPVEYTEWIINLLGKAKYATLKKKASSPITVDLRFLLSKKEELGDWIKRSPEEYFE